MKVLNSASVAAIYIAFICLCVLTNACDIW